jgi:hypothetical protein
MLGHRVAPGLALLALNLCLQTPVLGDEFERMGGNVLAALWANPGLQIRPNVAFRELEALPQVLRDSRGALLIVRTGLGNLARLQVSPGFRRRPQNEGPLVPILLVERFEVFDGGHPGSRLARGKELTLFPGFQLDLDTGQIVPEGMGGDLLFAARGQDDGTLSTLGAARMATMAKPPNLPPTAAGLPSEGIIARPGDFAGRFRLLANGQWSGLLELTVDPSGVVFGTFSSEASGAVHAVTGKVDGKSHEKIQFSIAFPRARQDYQGILWTEGKNVFAGTVTMLGRDFSFIAVREGTRIDLREDRGAKAP